MEKGNNIVSLSLQFESLVRDINKKIADLEQIGFNMQNYKEKIEYVKKKVGESIQGTESNKNDMVAGKELDANDLTMVYSELISYMENINKEIDDKYESFFVLSKSSSYISESLQNIQSSKDPVEILDRAIDLLGNIESSPTNDYNQEKHIIEMAYKTVYDVMKLESLTGNSWSSESIFNVVKRSNIHSSFIARLVLEDCKKSQDPKVLNKLHQLETQGMDNKTLIDTSLFRLLVLSSDEAYVKSLKESTQKTVRECQRTLDEIRSQAKIVESSKNSYLAYAKDEKSDLSRVLTRAAALIATLTISGLLAFTAYRGIEKGDIKYRTKSTEYDLQTGESYEGEDNGEYSFLSSTPVTVKEKSPWIYSESKDEYIRTVTEYELQSSPRAMDPSDYVKMIEGMDFSERDEDSSIIKPEDFDEQIAKYFVTIKEYDNEDTITGEYRPVSILCGFIIFMLVQLFELMVYCTSFNEEYLFLEDNSSPVIKDYFNSHRIAKASKRELEENTKKIRKLIDKYRNLLDSIKSTSYCRDLVPEYETVVKSDSELGEMVAQNAPSANLRKVL